jgi:hemoglobin/transferrin/lactoferrin receptor protein
LNRQPHVVATSRALFLLSAAGFVYSPMVGGITNEPLVRLPEIVTATRVEENPLTIPQSITTATKEEIRERQPSQPAEALRDEPAVWVQKTGAGGGTPVIRGLMGHHVLYLVDGIRINNCTAFAGPNPLFNQVDAGSIDQIEILEGPGSVQYGSDALGGILNIRTKALNAFTNQTTAGGMLSGHYSTVDSGKYGHGEGYLIGSNYNVLVGATSVDAQNYRAGGDEGTLDNTSYRSRGWMGKSQWKLSEGNVLCFGYLEDVRKDVERYDQSKRNASGIPRFFTPEETRRIVSLRDVMDFDSRWISQVEPYVYYQHCNSLSENTSEGAAQIIENVTDETQNQYGGGIQAISHLSDSIRLIYGADGRYEDQEQRITQLTTSKATEAVTRSTPTGKTPDGTYDVLDAFAMADWTPIERARLTGGLRFESTHLKSDPSELDVTDGFTVSDLRLDTRWNSMTYSVGGSYEVADGLILASDVATGFRSPTYSDVLDFGAFTYGVNVPSPNVQPEKITTWEIGPRFESVSVRAQATYFHSWLSDLITSEPTGEFMDLNGDGIWDAGEDIYASKNEGSGWIQGVETRGEWKIDDPFRVFGSCSWTESKNEDQDEPLRFTPPLHGTVGLRLQPSPQSWWIEVFARMVAAQDAVTAADKKDPARASDPARTFPSTDNPPLRSNYSIPGYTTYNVRAGLPVRKRSTIFLSCENLTDREYRVAFSRQDSPGINFTIGAEVKF